MNLPTLTPARPTFDCEVRGMPKRGVESADVSGKRMPCARLMRRSARRRCIDTHDVEVSAS
jgi:hypothetical protein